MKIAHMDAWLVTMRLDEPYTIAYETIETATNVFLRIETNTGIVGLGCAAPDCEVTGETPESAIYTMVDMIKPTLMGVDPLRRMEIMDVLRAEIKTQASALAAVDMALYDILGKISNLPVWKLLGGFRERMITSITIGILPEKETVERAKERVAQGFQSLKLKGGKELESDIARVLKVREAVGEEIQLRFDANQGYSVEETLKFINRSQNARLEFIEQPTPKDQPYWLGEVSKNKMLPIMADESLLSLDDAFHLAQHHLVNLFNIKLMKVGGITEAQQIDAVGKAAGIPAMVGCMDEAALGIAAGVHFALSLPNVKYADLDGHIGLLNDPSEKSLTLRQGMIFPNDTPGLGVQLNF